MAKNSPKHLEQNDKRWQTSWSKRKINKPIFEWLTCPVQPMCCKDLIKHEDISISDWIKKKKKDLRKTDPYNWTNSGFILSVKCPYESNQHTAKVQNKSITVSTYPFRKKEEKWKHHWLHALFSDSIHLSKLIFDIRSDLEGRHSDNSQKVENNIIPTNMNYLPAG